jgi:hypothetical protein
MDLDKPTNLLPTAKPASAGDPVREPAQVSLFEAVRQWIDDEGMGGFDIELDGARLTLEQIQQIAHSEEYKARLLAFDERR